MIRCAECREFVLPERVRHREERVKVSRPPAARSPLTPPLRPSTPLPARAPFAHRVPSRSPGGAVYEIERIPVCVDCLRRQRIGLLGVCSLVAACVVTAVAVYSQDRVEPTSRYALAEPPPVVHVAPTSAANPPSSPPPAYASLPASPSTRPTPAAAAAGLAPPLTAAKPFSTPPLASDSATAEATLPIDPFAQAAPTKPPPRHRERRLVAHKKPEPHYASSSALALRQDGYADLMERRYAEAFSRLQEASAMGDAYAPMYLGQAFEHGTGVRRDVGQASYWYGLAINRGNAAALTALDHLRLNPY